MTATTRVERDSLGSLEVPADALWGAQTQRAVNNFPPSGLRMPRAFIRALALIKHAAAGRWLGVTVRPEGTRVHVEVADRGVRHIGVEIRHPQQ